MKWKIAKLLKERVQEIKVNEEIDFTDAAAANPDIKSMTTVLVTGKGYVFSTDCKIVFDLSIKGCMRLACALTLDDVDYPFVATLHPVFVWDIKRYDAASEDYLVKDIIELAPVIWQEIYLRIPLRVVKVGAYEELERLGINFQDAQVLENDENQIDPRFAVLKELESKD